VWKPVPGRVPKRLHHVVEQLVIAVDEREFIVARVFERSAVQIAESSMDGLEPLPNRQVESTRWRTKTNDVLEVSLDPLLPLFGAAWLATRAKENGAAIREWHSHIFISPLPVNFAAIHAEVCQHRRPGGAQGNARVPPRDEVQCPNWSVSDDRIQADYVVTFATNGHGGSRLK
jgi:hypothetical protein